MTTTNNVTQLNVKPKTESHHYRKHSITISFEPRSKQWSWQFSHRPRLSFSGKEASLQRALRQAKKEVDDVIDGRN